MLIRDAIKRRQGEASKVKKIRLPLEPDLVFPVLCLVNVALTMVSG